MDHIANVESDSLKIPPVGSTIPIPNVPVPINPVLPGAKSDKLPAILVSNTFGYPSKLEASGAPVIADITWSYELMGCGGCEATALLLLLAEELAVYIGRP